MNRKGVEDESRRFRKKINLNDFFFNVEFAKPWKIFISGSIVKVCLSNYLTFLNFAKKY